MAKTGIDSASVTAMVREKKMAFQDEHQRKVLSISPAQADHEALRSALSARLWRVEEAFDYSQALACLCRQRMDIVVCAYHLPGGSWWDLIGQIAALPAPPPLIVTAASADEHLREAVKNVGGYEILSKPFHPGEVRRVLSAAWQDRSLGAGVLV